MTTPNAPADSAGTPIVDAFCNSRGLLRNGKYGSAIDLAKEFERELAALRSALQWAVGFIDAGKTDEATERQLNKARAAIAKVM